MTHCRPEQARPEVQQCCDGLFRSVPVSRIDGSFRIDIFPAGTSSMPSEFLDTAFALPPVEIERDAIESSSMPRRLLSQLSAKLGGRSSLDGRPAAPGSPAAPESSQPSRGGFKRSGTVSGLGTGRPSTGAATVRMSPSWPVRFPIQHRAESCLRYGAGVPLMPVGEQKTDVDAKIAEAESKLVEAERR